MKLDSNTIADAAQRIGIKGEELSAVLQRGSSVTYRPGDIYSSRDQNTTLNRLMNLGTFKFVKNRFEPVNDKADPYRLNVFYYLTPAKKKSVAWEIDGF